MTASLTAYMPRFYSEVIKEAGSPDDCTICSGLALFDAATLGEGVTRNNGRLFGTIRLRELRDEAGLAPNGDVRLDELDRYLGFLSRRAGLVPKFKLDFYPGNGGTLRLTFQQFKAKVRQGHIAILLGRPDGVKDPQSPLRTIQASDNFDHAIAVMRGDANGATIYDPLNRKDEDFEGVRCSWTDMRQFTEATKPGTNDRKFGTPDAIGCAVAKIGSATLAARIEGRLRVVRERATKAVAARDAAIQKRDQAIAARDAASQAQAAAEAARDAANQARDLANVARDAAMQAQNLAIAARDAALARIAKLEQQLAVK